MMATGLLKVAIVPSVCLLVSAADRNAVIVRMEFHGIGLARVNGDTYPALVSAHTAACPVPIYDGHGS